MAKKSSSKRSAKKSPSTRKPAKRSSARKPSAKKKGSSKGSKEKEIRFNMVISEKDQRDIKAKAKRAGMSMSAWVRETLRKAR